VNRLTLLFLGRVARRTSELGGKSEVASPQVLSRLGGRRGRRTEGGGAEHGAPGGRVGGRSATQGQPGTRHRQRRHAPANRCQRPASDTLPQRENETNVRIEIQTPKRVVEVPGESSHGIHLRIHLTGNILMFSGNSHVSAGPGALSRLTHSAYWYYTYLSITRQQLVPPKPNELDMTRLTSPSTRSVSMFMPSASSTRSSMLALLAR